MKVVHGIGEPKRLCYGKTMVISVLKNTHICMDVNKCKNCRSTPSWVARNIVSDVKANPNIKLWEVMKLIDQKFALPISFHMAWCGKEKAKEMIFGNVAKSYDYVETLKYELLKRNFGGHVDVKLEPGNAFQRMLVCFKVTKVGFKLGCRPFMGLIGVT